MMRLSDSAYGTNSKRGHEGNAVTYWVHAFRIVEAEATVVAMVNTFYDEDAEISRVSDLAWTMLQGP